MDVRRAPDAETYRQRPEGDIVRGYECMEGDLLPHLYQDDHPLISPHVDDLVGQGLRRCVASRAEPVLRGTQFADRTLIDEKVTEGVAA